MCNGHVLAHGAPSGPILYPHPGQGRGGAEAAPLAPPPLAPCSISLPPCRHRPLHRAGDGALSAPPLLGARPPFEAKEGRSSPGQGASAPAGSSPATLFLEAASAGPPPWPAPPLLAPRAPAREPGTQPVGIGRRRSRQGEAPRRRGALPAAAKEDASLGSGSRSLPHFRNKSRLNSSTLGLKRKT